MTIPDDLKLLLKTTKLEIQKYVTKLDLENLKLQDKIVDLQVKNTSATNKILALEKIIKKFNHSKDLSDDELIDKVQEIANLQDLSLDELQQKMANISNKNKIRDKSKK